MTDDERKVLHLTLHRNWFDAIRAGRKKEEYRNATPYWDSRLRLKDTDGDGCGGKIFKQFDEVRFVNGYGKNRPFMRVECKGIYVSFNTKRYVICLGKILEVGNVND